METIVLKDGQKIPTLCFGTPIIIDNLYTLKGNIKILLKSFLKKDKQIKNIIGMKKILSYISKSNFKIAVDTSRAYGYSEDIIGSVSKKNRDNFFIITKISNTDQYNGSIEEVVKQSLEKMKIKQIDLLLFHWPVDDIYIKTWEKMIEIQKKGLCKSIGVCNCNIHHLERIKKETGLMPLVNEIECHPLFTQKELRDYCKKNDIKVIAYTSLARMDERLNKTCLVDYSKKYHKSIPQIILRWHYQIGNIPIFNTSNLKSFIKNIDIYDFELTDEEINNINNININSRLRYDPDNCDFSKL